MEHFGCKSCLNVQNLVPNVLSISIQQVQYFFEDVPQNSYLCWLWLLLRNRNFLN